MKTTPVSNKMWSFKPYAQLGQGAFTVLLLAGVAAAQVPDLEREAPDLQARRAEYSQRKFGSSAEPRIKAWEQVRAMHPVSFQTPTAALTLQAAADHRTNSAAPSGVAGAFQVNAVIPAGVTPGSAVPMVLKVGSVASPVVYVAIR
jgi:hypothetical protein